MFLNMRLSLKAPKSDFGYCAALAEGEHLLADHRCCATKCLWSPEGGGGGGGVDWWPKTPQTHTLIVYSCCHQKQQNAEASLCPLSQQLLQHHRVPGAGGAEEINTWSDSSFFPTADGAFSPAFYV